MRDLYPNVREWNLGHPDDLHATRVSSSQTLADRRQVLSEQSSDTLPTKTSHGSRMDLAWISHGSRMDLDTETLNNVKQTKINIYLFAYLYIYSYLCNTKETKKKLKQEEMRDYLEEIPEEIWEYVESWFQFNNNQKQTTMKKSEVKKQLMNWKKEDLVDLMADVIDGLNRTYEKEENEENCYTDGWNDSRKAVREIYLRNMFNYD